MVVLGLGRYGSRLLTKLLEDGIPALGVDFDPQTVRGLQRRGLPAHFGDGEDPSFRESLSLDDTQTLPLWESNRNLMSALGEIGFKAKVAAVVRDRAHGQMLLAAGVYKYLNPFDDAADHAARGLVQDLLQEQPP